MAPIDDAEASLFHTERISQYVSLSPASLSSPLPALCASIFSPLLLSYFPPAKGIVLAYEDVQLSATPPPTSASKSKSNSKSRSRSKRTHSQPQPVSEPEDSQDEEDNDAAQAPQHLLLTHIDEYSAPFLWATATFLVFRPTPQTHIAATLTHASHTHITLSYLNTFPVAVLAAHLPSAWTWHAEDANRMKKGWDGRIADEGGWWVDGEGARVEEGREVQVRIREVEGGRGRGKGFLRIGGSLLSVEEEGRGEVGQQGVRGKKGKGVLRVGGLRVAGGGEE